jgi:hypothetical protein
LADQQPAIEFGQDDRRGADPPLFVAEKPRVRSPVGIDLPKDTIERLANAPVTAFVRSWALVDVLLDVDVLRGNPFVYVFVYPSTFATPYATGRE